MRGNATHNLLNVQQVWLKMITKVMYDYASTSFSARPTFDGLADDILSCAQNAVEKIRDYMEDA